MEAILYLYDSCNQFKKVLERRSEYSLFETWLYFVQKLRGWPDVWGGKNWTPSIDDLLRARIRTLGRRSFQFQRNDQRFRLFDISGQQVERRRYMYMFSKMNCMLFVGNLSEYDESLFEDALINRLGESLRLWEKTIKSPDMEKTYVVLFLNKFDLFQQKYYLREKRVPIDYNNPLDPPPPTAEDEVNEKCAKALNWFKGLFVSRIPQHKKNDVEVLVTSAVDNNNIHDQMGSALEFLQDKLKLRN